MLCRTKEAKESSLEWDNVSDDDALSRYNVDTRRGNKAEWKKDIVLDEDEDNLSEVILAFLSLRKGSRRVKKREIKW